MSLVAVKSSDTSLNAGSARAPAPTDWEAMARMLAKYFDAGFTIWDGQRGELLSGTKPRGDETAIGAFVRVAAERGEVQCLIETGCLSLLAIPWMTPAQQSVVALSLFATGDWVEGEANEVAQLLGASVDELRPWHAQQASWPPHALVKLGRAARDNILAEGHSHKLTREIESVSENLASTYEEISLLYAVTQNLRISSTDEELGRLAIEWLGECVPAEAFAVLYTARDADETTTEYEPGTQSRFITNGNCPIDEDEFTRLIEFLPSHAANVPFVANDRADVSWHFPGVRQLIAVPMVEGDNVFGWLAVFNHSEGGAFGTVEANLIGSLGTLLGIHCGNRALYRQQSELLADIVRALVSAIDAKDPYTSGHSDRVARLAVRLADELKCSRKLVQTIYMAGLLHDVGKIGIDDNVLRKAGRLTDFEFEHIKRHPELGFKILGDLKPLSDVLPAVLHHHEQWDGGGYPAGLAGDEIPLIARIMAVADAYDAMTSDRPYRNGMPEETVYEIFRTGAGRFWDPQVVEAFFRAKDDLRAISDRERTAVDAFHQQFI